MCRIHICFGKSLHAKFLRTWKKKLEIPNVCIGKKEWVHHSWLVNNLQKKIETSSTKNTNPLLFLDGLQCEFIWTFLLMVLAELESLFYDESHFLFIVKIMHGRKKSLALTYFSFPLPLNQNCSEVVVFYSPHHSSTANYHEPIPHSQKKFSRS